MLAESTVQTSSVHDPEHLRHLIAEACEPIAQFWPMKRFVHHNPLHGLEHLTFDQAVKEARHLLGGNGYLPNSEYRQLYREGRITSEGVTRALQRVGPPIAGHPSIQAASRRIESSQVLRAHLLFGLEPLDPMLLQWTLGAGGALKRFQRDLPAESRQRIPGAGETYLKDLWASTLHATHTDNDREQKESAEPFLPRERTVGDWLDMHDGTSIVEQINGQMTKWVAAFVDEGMAGWEMPGRQGGFYRAWRDLAPRDFSGRFLGIKNFAQEVRGLPESPEDAISASLKRLGVPDERWQEYLSRHLAQLPGWAGLIRWLGENPTYSGQAGHPTNPIEYLAVRLFYEVEIADAYCRRKWGIPGTVAALVQRHAVPHSSAADSGTELTCKRAWPVFRLAQFLALTPQEVRGLSSESVDAVLGWLDTFPPEKHGSVWLEAYEDKYRSDLLGKLATYHGEQARRDGRPRAQIVFCIDVRSESFRRHVEAQGPYETYGFAGFFGVAMNHQAFDSGEDPFPLCPVLLKPAHFVEEAVWPGHAETLQTYASGSRWRMLGDHLFHDLKQNPVASFMLVDLLGLFFSLGLAGKTLIPRFHELVKGRIRSWFRASIATRIAVDKAANENGLGTSGFTREEQANMVENGLRAIGLTKDFGRFIVVCGHGSASDNNPYFGALHCGACGGKHGDPNARAFAAMGNHPEVRRLLKDRGLDIPADCWILAAKHITTSDRVLLYDVEDVPATHREDLRILRSDLEKAGTSQSLERCHRMPRSGEGRSAEKAYQHVAARSVDWANVRPEWGLSSNAAFVIGRRSLTQSVNLQGRVFLHSYDPEQDAEGKILEKIMTAPLVVGQWINMEHYFSGVDPWFWGSGSKVIHNVVSGVGVMPGSQGDLQTGLPLQTVNNGTAHYHEPMRLLTVIEAPTVRISEVIRKHALLQRLFHHQWLNLVSLDPGTFEFQRYNPDGAWEPASVIGANRSSDSSI